ncbi:MAG TPA: hypothetical protein VEI97_15645, partial [bacterium]|nr:hypothetical protein [bacterium]
HWTITEPYRGSNPMSVTLDPSGQRFAAGSNEGKLIFGTVADGKVTASRDMPMSVLGALTWPSPERLLIGGSDRTITTINPDTGAPPVALPGHRGRVRSLALLADGHTLVSRGEREPQLRVWDLESGRDLVHLPVTSEDLVPLVVNEAKTTWVVDNDVWRLDRAAEYLELTPIVPAAAARLAGQPGNAEALRTLGRWCHLRGDWAWAAEHLEEARKVGAAVDPLMLGQCYWQLGRTDDATQELQASLEATNDGAQRWYLQRCLEALQAPPGS